jgi:Na+/melibiose symporter-like transporter
MAALLLPLYVLLPALYAEQQAVGLAVTGLVLLVARLWDLVTDPIVGVLSDRIPTRLGRRRPYILLGCPIAVLSAWALFTPGADSGWLYLLGWSVALYLGTSMILVPYTAWGAELSSDYDERSRIAGAREVFVILGTAMVLTLPLLYESEPAAVLDALAHVLIFLLPLSVIILCYVVPERMGHEAIRTSPRRAWRTIRRNGPFRRLLAAYLLNGIANGLPASLFLLFVGHVLDSSRWPLFLLVYFLCGAAAVPFWIRVSRRINKHKVWIASMIASCAVFAWVPLLGPGDEGWFIAICALTGLALGADIVLPASMQADVIDVDTALTGRGRAGTFFAFWGIATKLALALAVGLAFPVLDLFEFDPAAAVQPPLATTVLAALYSLVPVAFKLGAIALVWRFPLTRARQQRLRQVIDRRRRRVESLR